MEIKIKNLKEFIKIENFERYINTEKEYIQSCNKKEEKISFLIWRIWSEGLNSSAPSTHPLTMFNRQFNFETENFLSGIIIFFILLIISMMSNLFVSIVLYLFWNFFTSFLSRRFIYYSYAKNYQRHDDFQNLFKYYDESFWIAFSKKNIVGTIAYSKKTGQVRRMWVSSQVRRKGVGTRLYKELEKYCRKILLKEIKLVTVSHSNQAVAFYKKHQFKIIDNYFIERKKFNSIINLLTGCSIIEMKKVLKY